MVVCRQMKARADGTGVGETPSSCSGTWCWTNICDLTPRAVAEVVADGIESWDFVDPSVRGFL
jgi:hypothetical protein